MGSKMRSLGISIIKYYYSTNVLIHKGFKQNLQNFKISHIGRPVSKYLSDTDKIARYLLANYTGPRNLDRGIRLN